jgi:hypothetical protein
VARLASRLDLSVRAVRPGVLAWRGRVDTSTFEVQTPASQQRNLDYLIRIVSPGRCSEGLNAPAHGITF